MSIAKSKNRASQIIHHRSNILNILPFTLPKIRGMHTEQYLENADFITGTVIGMSGGVTVLGPEAGLIVSAILPLFACLVVFGFFKSRVTGQPPVIGALKGTL